MTESTGTGDTEERSTDGPVGAMLGAAFGPFGAAVGSVVDANRIAFSVRIGTGADDSGSGCALDDAATVDVEEPDGSGTPGPGGDENAASDNENATQ
jgi:hypothetical protein